MSKKPIGGRLRRTKRLRKKYWKHIRVVDSGIILMYLPPSIVYRFPLEL